jgi:crotonobetainyl-CoA:carnitine CoA-transferase CaiB-like acyl-CoA transferase
MNQALSHVRVLDLSRVLAGPWATQILADLGADVLKIERPGSGDDTRSWGPPFLRDTAGAETNTAAYYASTNRGKRSIAIDFTRPEGRELVHRLVQGADVVIENFKVGALARHGLDYDSLKARKPDLVYCSITGFGQSGPYAARAGYDLLIQGMGGLMSVTGEPDGVPGGGPMKVGVALADIMTGFYATIGVLAALAARDRTGEGQHVDLALLDVQVATLANQAMNYLVTGKPPARLGNAHPNIAPYQPMRSADGYIILAVGNDAQFARLCEVVSRPELASDERFATLRARVANREALLSLLGEILREKPSRWWIQELEAVGVPCGPINDLADVFADPHVRERGLRIELPHPVAGTVPGVANPIRLSRTPVRYEKHPPMLGEHTFEVLAEAAGATETELRALEDAGVIEQWRP